MESNAAKVFALISLRFLLLRIVGTSRVVTSEEPTGNPRELRKLPGIPILVRQLGGQIASRLTSKTFLKKHTLGRYISFREATWSRYNSFLTRRDDRTSITLRMMVVSVCIATQFDLDVEKLEELIWYAFCIAIEHGTDKLTKMWKDVTNVLQNLGFQNEVPNAKMAVDKEHCSFFEKLLAVSDRIRTVTFIENYSNEEQEYLEKVLWMLSHIGQSRFLPPPSFRLAGDKTIDFIAGVTDPTRISSQGAEDLGRILGHKIGEMAKKQKKNLFQSTHVSLSNGSCWEASREELGKWSILTEGKAFAEYLNDRVLDRYECEDGVYRDHFGNILCSASNADYQIWRIAYVSGPPIDGELGEQYNIKGTFADMLFAKGFDARIGQLLHSWATWENYSRPAQPLNAKLIIVTEPGGKIRPLTSGEVWAYVYMVPAMHMLKDAVECLPGARVGLNESDNLWRFGNSYERHFGNDPGDSPEYISSSDLTSATDRAYHNVSRDLMYGLVSELNKDRGMLNYLIEAVDLCCSPRTVTYKAKGQLLRRLTKGLKDRNVPFQKNGKSIVFTTTRGVMMGDPITKVILTASSMGAYYASINDFRQLSDVSFRQYLINRRHHTVKRGPHRGRVFGPGKKMFACAGDDHVMLGTRAQVLMPPRFLESMGYEISWEKYRVSRRFVHYCQDFGLAPRFRTGIKIDTIKLRLLNQFQKMGSHKQFEFPDPLIGKAKGLEREFNFMKNAWHKTTYEESVIHDLERLMPAFIRCGMPSFFEERVFKDPMVYAPTRIGGLGIPNAYISWMETKADEVDLLERTAYLMKIDPTFIGEKVKTWCRGILFQQQVINLKPFAENLVQVSEYKDLFEKTRTTLDEGSTTPSSMRRVTRQLHSDNVNLMMPNPLIGSKESVFSEIYSGRGQKQRTNRRKRARQALAALRRTARENSGVILDFPREDIDWNNIPGMWVSRTELHYALGISGNSPGLTLSKNYFSGDAGRYEIDEEIPRLSVIAEEDIVFSNETGSALSDE